MSPEFIIGLVKAVAAIYLIILATSATISLAKIAKSQAKIAGKC